MRTTRALALCGALHALALWGVLLALLYRLALRPTPNTPACEAEAAVLFSDSVVLPSGMGSAFVHVGDDGTIAHVSRAATAADAASYAASRGLPFDDLRGLTISPGLIDAPESTVVAV